jgi:3-hydroxybutyryl-CoA dehydrogenase
MLRRWPWRRSGSSARSRVVSKGGKLDASHAEVALARITLSTEWDALAGAGLVIEAVSENLELKLAVMRSIDHVVDQHAIVASNTSSIPIAELAQACGAPSV